MIDERYERWRKFCKESDEQVKNFKDEKGCPFCGGEGKARWDYDDYDEWFIIECDTCSCRVKESTFEAAVNTWNRRVK